MKRILLSIGIAFALLVVYLTITSIIVAVGDFDRNLISTVQVPVRLPQMVLYYFYPPTAEDYKIEMNQRKALLALLLFAANILLYSIPVYFLLGLLSRYRKPKPLPSDEPPLPPTF